MKFGIGSLGSLGISINYYLISNSYCGCCVGLSLGKGLGKSLQVSANRRKAA
jgi:hypothetical protein